MIDENDAKAWAKIAVFYRLTSAVPDSNRFEHIKILQQLTTRIVEPAFHEEKEEQEKLTENHDSEELFSPIQGFARTYFAKERSDDHWKDSFWTTLKTLCQREIIEGFPQTPAEYSDSSFYSSDESPSPRAFPKKEITPSQFFTSPPEIRKPVLNTDEEAELLTLKAVLVASDIDEAQRELDYLVETLGIHSYTPYKRARPKASPRDEMKVSSPTISPTISPN